MYKALCVAVLLLATFAFTSGSKPADASTPPFTTPVIVAKGKLVNQTTTIPTTTIFTPPQDGLYRLSVYGTISKADPSSSSLWYFSPLWIDDGGNENASYVIAQGGGVPGQFSLYYQNFSIGGVTLPFEAKAGTAITYAVNQSGPPDNSAYSIYFTLERLE